MDCNWIGWCGLTASEQAAWVQAVGSIAAIATAIWVPAWQRRRDRQAKATDQALQAKVVAGALQPFIPAYRRRAAYLLNALKEGQSAEQLKSIPEHAFDVTETIKQFHPSFHYLGATGELANRFVASLFWLQQGLMAIHHERLRPETREQIRKDCENTINFALELSPLLERVGGRIDRLPGNVDIVHVVGD
ncbi:hypothetical protein [Stenotrophomonas maltophilia]|uniref:hypothetical protein n=1 Tax=Stenotrophomonas maltophilia TaxID=40324 RepID=UPI001F53A7F5|nr:hypothetical protein [Stenotrophomonas maltophilia]MCI1149002.1 hypothetical protein [Stenotrophomonas maltophilia]